MQIPFVACAIRHYRRRCDRAWVTVADLCLASALRFSDRLATSILLDRTLSRNSLRCLSLKLLRRIADTAKGAPVGIPSGYQLRVLLHTRCAGTRPRSKGFAPSLRESSVYLVATTA